MDYLLHFSCSDGESQEGMRRMHCYLYTRWREIGRGTEKWRGSGSKGKREGGHHRERVRICFSSSPYFYTSFQSSCLLPNQLPFVIIIHCQRWVRNKNHSLVLEAAALFCHAKFEWFLLLL